MNNTQSAEESESLENVLYDTVSFSGRIILRCRRERAWLMHASAGGQ